MFRIALLGFALLTGTAGPAGAVDVLRLLVQASHQQFEVADIKALLTRAMNTANVPSAYHARIIDDCVQEVRAAVSAGRRQAICGAAAGDEHEVEFSISAGE